MPLEKFLLLISNKLGKREFLIIFKSLDIGLASLNFSNKPSAGITFLSDIKVKVTASFKPNFASFSFISNSRVGIRVRGRSDESQVFK